MNQHRSTKHTRCRGQARPAPGLARCRTTVIGLDGIGRQVALQLAARGVPRLQLIDHRTVARSTHAAEGYAHDNIGRPKVYAAAQRCHQLNPRLELHTVRRRSLQGLQLGQALFCCPLTNRVRRWLGGVIGDKVVFAAACVVVAHTAHIRTAC